MLNPLLYNKEYQMIGKNLTQDIIHSDYTVKRLKEHKQLFGMDLWEFLNGKALEKVVKVC